MMARMLNFEFEQLETEVQHLVETGDLEGLRELLTTHHPADIADIVERIEDDDTRLRVFELLPLEQAAEVLHEMGGHATRELIDDLSSDQVGDLLDQLSMDDAVELLTEDVPERQKELLALMEPDDAAEVRDLLQYPPDSAGRLMTEKYVRILGNLTASEAIEHLRKVDSQVETLNDLYIMNGDRRLLGVVSLREVITAPPNTRLSDIMTTQVVSVQPETDQEEVARMVSRYNFLAIPVVTPDGRMLGIITVDDVIDILVRETTEDIMRFSGVEGGGLMDQPYFTLPILSVVRKRFGWLLLLFLAETLTGSVLRLFEGELAQVVALSFFIPLLIGTGGNTGAQTVSTIIRGLALSEIRLRDTVRVIMRELGSGFLLGLALGVVGLIRTILWGQDLHFSLVIGLSLLVICTWANTIGSLIPLVAHRLKIDPAVVSAPLITTLVDATGLAIYFLIAKVLLSL
jgi:magnesium transporter